MASMAWFQSRTRNRPQVHEHDYRAQQVGAGLSRKICQACGHISLAVMPMRCWAKTEAGAHCRAYTLKAVVGPVCWAHARSPIDWRQMILDAVAQRYQAPTPIVAPSTVIQLDLRRTTHKESGRPLVVSAAG